MCRGWPMGLHYCSSKSRPLFFFFFFSLWWELTYLHSWAWVFQPTPFPSVIRAILCLDPHTDIDCRYIWLSSPLNTGILLRSLLALLGRGILEPQPRISSLATLEGITSVVTPRLPSLQAVTHHALSIHWARILIHSIDSS